MYLYQSTYRSRKMENVSYELYQEKLIVFKHINGEIVDQTDFDLNDFDLNDSDYLIYGINNGSFLSKEGGKIENYVDIDKLIEDVKYHSEFV